METIDKQFSGTELNISTQSSNYLKYAAKWANFLAIMGFIGLGLMVLGALLILTVGANFGRVTGSMAPVGVMAFTYLVMAVLYFFPTYYLYNFAGKMKKAIANTSLDDMEAGFENLKSFFKFLGIFTIVIVSLYVLIAIFAGIGAAVAYS